MSRNDIILLTVFVSLMVVLILAAFAPVADDATLTMRAWAVTASPIFIATVSTFIAAFAGTWGAQLLAERMANRRMLLAEIRHTNNALGLVFTIANAFIVAKKQHVRALVQDYESQVAAREAHIARHDGFRFIWRLELQTITMPFSPIEELREMLREKITPDGRAMILLTPLVQSVHGFAETVLQRNGWIREVQAMPEGSDAKKAAWFFGYQYAPGVSDVRYPSYIEALKAQNDDCIAYSLLIGESLVKYGERLVARYGRGAPKITTANFDKVAEFLPDMSKYEDWKN